MTVDVLSSAHFVLQNVAVPLKQDRVMMFMEYCDTGTVEDAAKMGLPEYLMRRYTGELILAVAYLHENSIVHRDIKGASCRHRVLMISVFLGDNFFTTLRKIIACRDRNG